MISGESNAYTIGYIGEHKVVSTKLPMIGHGRAAQISSGNTTTRLLGKYWNNLTILTRNWPMCKYIQFRALDKAE